VKEYASIAVSEGQTLDFPLAGPLSRLLAYGIDLAVTGVVYLGLGLLVLTSAAFDEDALTSAASTLAILLFFVVQWLYFVGFEAVWGGRTPGKYAAGLRVIRDDGLDIGWQQSMLRNILRGVDMWPPPLYALGALTSLVNARGKRLGDLAAGTIVVHETFDLAGLDAQLDSTARWAAKVGRGASRAALLLPGGTLELSQLVAVEQFLGREPQLTKDQRRRLSWSLARPLLPLFNERPEDWEDRLDRTERALAVLRDVRARAADAEGREARAVESRRDAWIVFGEACERLRREGRRGVSTLGTDALVDLVRRYRVILADLARARGLGADAATVRVLNRLAVAGHLLLGSRRVPAPWRLTTAPFRAAVRRCRAHVALAAALLVVPGVVGFVAVGASAQLAFDLVPLSFQHFEPARSETMHEVPALARPVMASGIITNNIQVTFLAFALGMTAGLGTVLVIVFNGVHIGATAAWFHLRDQSLPFWGFVAPHGVTELLAIVLAAAAGFRLAEAIVFPGSQTRRSALVEAGREGLAIIVGSMVMLGIAGLIEGFVSPTSAPLGARWAIAGLSAVFWAWFFGRAVPGTPPLR
jgi:uncharacterized membrane protein SpoIIM required for sporulation/uncharacterized RDD family membrane protein YckC